MVAQYSSYCIVGALYLQLFNIIVVGLFLFLFFLGEVFGLGVGGSGEEGRVRGILNAQVLVLLCLGVVARADQSLLEFLPVGKRTLNLELL